MATTKLRARKAATSGLLVVSVISVMVGLSACAGSGDAPTDGTVSGTLQVLTPSADSSDKAFEALNAAFEAKYPDVTVEYTTVPTNNYSSAMSSRLTAGNVDVLVAAPVEVPDYAADSKGNDALAAEAGTFLDLTDEPFMDNFTPSVVESLLYDGKNYVVPTGLSYYTGVYYNKDLFAELGLEIPTTWDEFIAVCEAIKAAGIAPLGIGGKDSWPAGLTMLAAVQGAYPTAESKLELAASLWDGSTKLDDPAMVDILDKVETMYGYAEANFSGVSYSQIPSEFANGTVAMTPDGTWNAPTITAAVGENFEFGYFPIPTSDDPANNATLGGKVEIRIAIASSTKNKTAALAYLEFYSDPENYAPFVAQAGFAPAQPDIPSSEFLDSIAPYTATFTPAWDILWAPNTKAGPAALFPFNYPGIAPLGTADAKGAAEAAQKDWAAGF